MKAILEFNLPEENVEHLKAIKADNLLSVIYDLNQEIRKKIKYEQKEHFQEFKDLLYKSLEDNNVSLEEFNLI